MELLTSEVQAVFQDFISTKGGWISEATKAIANEKIENIARSIGYPDSILNINLLDEEVKGVSYTKVLYWRSLIYFIILPYFVCFNIFWNTLTVRLQKG